MSVSVSVAVAAMAASQGGARYDAALQKGYTCSITLSVMQHPVTTACGCNFERKDIEKYLEPRTQDKCPVCRATLVHKELSINRELRNTINDFNEDWDR